MEILFEILFAVLSFLGEMVLQVVFEIVAEIMGHAVREPFKRKPLHPALAALGYALMGAVAGGVSLLIFPHSFVDSEILRGVNLIFTPVMAGLAMAAIGRWRDKRDQDLIRLDRFSYGFLFAFTMALVRFFGVA